jgi:hypothetical protein
VLLVAADSLSVREFVAGQLVLVCVALIGGGFAVWTARKNRDADRAERHLDRLHEVEHELRVRQLDAAARIVELDQDIVDEICAIKGGLLSQLSIEARHAQVEAMRAFNGQLAALGILFGADSQVSRAADGLVKAVVHWGSVARLFLDRATDEQRADQEQEFEDAGQAHGRAVRAFKGATLAAVRT